MLVAPLAAVAAPTERERQPEHAGGPEGPRDQGSESLVYEQAQQLLRALADPIRMRVIVGLGKGERCVCDLTSELGLAQSKLSFHLRVLRDAGLITARQQGRWMYYSLEPQALMRLRDWLEQLSDGCSEPAPPCA
jgi:ArsR family transcriptional regulator